MPPRKTAKKTGDRTVNLPAAVVTESSGDGTPRHLLFGRLRRTYLLPPDGKSRLDVPGGNLLYAAGGLAAWETGIGLVARVGQNFPPAWLASFEAAGFDVRGVTVLDAALDLREFIAYTDRNTRHTSNPIQHFARLGLSFPHDLLGYKDPAETLDNIDEFTTYSLREKDLPPVYLDAQGAHFCPLDFISHSLLPAILRQRGFTTLTLDPGPGYMHPNFFNHIPGILSGLTAFLTSEEKLRALFRGRSEDVWEMIESLAAYGSEAILVKRAVAGQLLYDTHSKSRWEIPAYPGREVDLTGAGDSFAGGFLAGWRRTFDPLQAAIHGNVSASLTIEGQEPFFPLQVLPGLAQARLEVLRESVRKL